MKGKICILLSILLLVAAICLPHLSGETESAAAKVGRIASSRMAILERYADKMLQTSPYEWPDIGELPQDMVIYRYVDDSLQCWVNQFSVMDDNIARRSVYKRLVNPKMPQDSPLSEVGDSLGFYNFGPRWYLARSRREGNVRLIYGLIVQNSLDSRTFNGVNPAFRLSDNYSLQPLSCAEGSVVRVDSRPLLRVRYESLSGGAAANGLLVWLAFATYVLGALLLLVRRRTLKQLLRVSAGLLLAVGAMYVWGRSARDQSVLFSPILYADGPVFYSLGAVALINLYVLLLALCLYMVRGSLTSAFGGKWAGRAFRSAVAVSIAAVLLYTHFSLRSIILNSDVSLELYKFETLSVYTLIVYLSYLTMLMSVPMLLCLLRPGFLTLRSRAAFGVSVAVYLVLASSVLGFRKEQERIDVWASRIAFERDASLELLLRGLEPQVASDPVIASLTLLEEGENSILHRLSDVYLARLSSRYDFSILSPEEYLQMRAGMEAISPDSNFFVCLSQDGHPRYVRMFFYDIPGYGVTHFALCVEPRSDAPDRGSIPPIYSYARYRDSRVLSMSGSYAYPLKMNLSPGHYIYDGSTHFVVSVGEGGFVVMSRPNIAPAGYVISLVLLSLIAFFAVSLLLMGAPARRHFERGYYRARMDSIVMGSLTLTLLAMMTVSVVYVYRRNETNLRNQMSEKIGGIQSVLSPHVRSCRSAEELRPSEIFPLVETLSVADGTDVSLYSSDGRQLWRGGPGAPEDLNLGSRMNGEAFRRIVFDTDRYCVVRERVAGHRFYGMYAPLVGADGSILVIAGAPYMAENSNIDRDAAMHLATILAVFLLLLIFARFSTTTIVDRIFKPLGEMGRRMSQAGKDSLQKIEYDRDDEITSLVQSYNRMVDELEESSRVLAQAERDKAWSGMARQVAHEIKNPLTPMKLQLQRIMRLKAKGDPSWQDKFDEMSAVLLDHIDILTDTANEFSTFAKLYTEEPSEIDLDALIKEEISMFDNREGVKFEYFGLEGARASGPKPQLTRVFVNLLGNAVQALDGKADGIVRVALRNSSQDGCYDIVFEDNGPGVDEANESKLFTPNFTTKNGGSGLGLAISRSILERCGACISYSRSFSLGGACFTIRYPK